MKRLARQILSNRNSEAVAVFLMFTVLSCKLPPSSSETSSVDNLVASESVEFALNECTGKENNPEKGAYLYKRDQDDPRKIAEKKSKSEIIEDIVNNRVKFLGENKNQNFKSIIKDVLTPLPLDILMAFQLELPGNEEVPAHKNYIFIHDAPPPACNGKEESKGNTKNEFVPFSCYSLGNDKNDNQRGVHLGSGKISKSDGTQKDVTVQQAIRHGLTKAMVFFYTFLVKETAENKDTPGTHSEPILALGAKLEKALEKDLSYKNGGEKSGSEWDKIKSTPDLKWVILGHVYDSAFCSRESRKVLATCYPNTFKVFMSDGREKADIDINDKIVAACSESRRALVHRTWGS